MKKLVFMVIIFAVFHVLLMAPSFAADDNENPCVARVIPRKVAPKDWQEFKSLKAKYYGQAFLDGLKTADHAAHFYEVTRKDGYVFHILGTEHQAPFEFLPDNVQTCLARASHIYVESDGCMERIQKSLDGREPIPGELLGTMEHLKPHLRYQLTHLEEGFDLSSVGTHALFLMIATHDDWYGMEEQIVLQAHLGGKGVFALDEAAESDDNPLQTALDRDKAELENEIEDSPEGSDHRRAVVEELRLLTEEPEKYMSLIIGRAMEHFTDQQGLQDFLRSDLIEFGDDLPTLEDLKEELGYELDQVTARNQRWLQILKDVKPDSVICVGADHLPGLFDAWKQEGHTITRVE